MAVSFSMTVDCWFREAPALAAVAGRFSVESVLWESEAGRWELRLDWPGCLKIPKFTDFLCG
jgi:hypothetical protein